ncbi:heavy metal-binding domain-containing protein [Marinospirillum sp.]|uniref:YbjQ family protein n=1 Tax=Marinospirillum sp. TaxID=2183934 RepID=UPI00384D2279
MKALFVEEIADINGNGAVAGIKEGDIIVAVNGQRVESFDTFIGLISDENDSVLDIVRDGVRFDIAVKSGKVGISLIAKDAGFYIRNAISKSRLEISRSKLEIEDNFEECKKFMQITTAPTLEGYRIVKTVDIITAECAFGMNIFKDFFAGVSDFFGGRNKSTQNVLKDARITCLNELKSEAAKLGVNAVIGVDLDYSEFSGAGKSMLFLVASGTAVVVEKIDS